MVGAENLPEQIGVTLRLVDPLHRVALGLLDRSLGFTVRLGDNLVVLRLGGVNGCRVFLLCLVDVVPRRLDGLGRVDVLQNHLVELDAQLILGRQRLQLLFHFLLNLTAPGGEHLVDRTIADDLAHDRLVHRAERLDRVAHFEEIVVCVGNHVLCGPLDISDVEVAGDNEGCISLATTPGRITGAGPGSLRDEPKLQLVHRGNLDVRHPVDVKRPLEM